ncbi:MAG: DinB family protein [Labilithrix sp.]|nr:DinB family protein [Labilithrix sp.]
MIDTKYVVTMAAYNRWQNDNLYRAAGALSEADRRRDRGAFFGSIHGTLNHILWADEVWMGRFTGCPHPTTPIARSRDRYEDWEELRAARVGLDADIVAWAETLDPAWLTRSQVGSAGRKKKAPRGRWKAAAFSGHVRAPGAIVLRHGSSRLRIPFPPRQARRGHEGGDVVAGLRALDPSVRRARDPARRLRDGERSERHRRRRSLRRHVYRGARARRELRRSVARAPRVRGGAVSLTRLRAAPRARRPRSSFTQSTARTPNRMWTPSRTRTIGRATCP